MSRISAVNCSNGVSTARARLAAVFCWPGDGVGRRRKDGERYPGGRLKHRPSDVPPNELTLEHRARVVGWMHALDQKSASLIGQARLLGLLHDPIVLGSDGRQVARADRRANARYDALDDFVRLHRAVYGISSAQSILKNQIGTGDGSVRDNAGDNAGAYRRLSRMIKRVRDGAPFIRANTRQLVVPLHVLQRVAGDEVVNGAGQPDINLLSQGELAALRWAADALLDRVEGADEAKPAEPATNRRAKSYMPLFDGDRTGIDDEALAAAVERLRGSGRGET